MRVAVLALLGALAACGGSSAPREPDDITLIVFGQEEVKKLLRDPSSAEFSNVRVSRKAGVPAICGYVNSNNGFGGKTGPQRFISGGATAIEEQFAPGEMDQVWTKFC